MASLGTRAQERKSARNIDITALLNRGRKGAHLIPCNPAPSCPYPTAPITKRACNSSFFARCQLVGKEACVYYIASPAWGPPRRRDFCPVLLRRLSFSLPPGSRGGYAHHMVCEWSRLVAPRSGAATSRYVHGERVGDHAHRIQCSPCRELRLALLAILVLVPGYIGRELVKGGWYLYFRSGCSLPAARWPAVGQFRRIGTVGTYLLPIVERAVRLGTKRRV